MKHGNLVEFYEPGAEEATLVEAARSRNYHGYVWIGLKSKKLDWTWVDGEPLQIDNWEEEDNGGDAPCALMSESGGWRGAECWLKHNVLCEGGE